MLTPGSRVFDRYVVEAFLGEGGMGRVYLARHSLLGMQVALKVLHPDADADLVTRFEREAKLMARVRHPNVVAITDFGALPDGSCCIAMEYVDGEALARLVERVGALPWPVVVAIVRPLLAGLDAIHRAGIVHRDLKPANVMLGPGGPDDVKVLDFGIARGSAADATRYTKSGLVVGTPGYMAPEQVVGAAVDARTDVYAAALIAYELLTGKPPFGGDAPSSVMARLTREVPPPVAPAGRPEIPAHVAASVVAALSFAPERRPVSALELGAMLAGEHPAPDLAPASMPYERTAFAPSWAPPSSAIQSAASAAPSGVATAIPRRFVLVARLPPSRLVRPDERKLLAELAGSSTRSYALGSDLWVAISAATHPARAEQEAERIETALAERYGSLAAVAWQLAGDGFAMTAASLTGAAPLPSPLPELIEKLGA